MESIFMYEEQDSTIQINIDEKQVSIPYSEISVERQKITDGVLEFIAQNIDFDFGTEFTNTVEPAEIIDLDQNSPINIVNFEKVNDARRLNKFFESVNYILPDEGKFIGCVETIEKRKEVIQKEFKKFWKVAYWSDFFIHRLLPKLPIIRNFYFNITKGKNRAISKAEVLGRLISCGFEIKDYKCVNNLLYYVAHRKENPTFDKNPTYGPIVNLKRVGYQSKLIDVYKIRTMHPYSEYLQKQLYETNGTKDGDKIRNDFRVTSWGRFLRKFWLDELPMLINLIKGDIKLVGVRPLSRHKFKTYPSDLQLKRVKTKPGLIPPYYADLPETPEEFFNAERKYIEEYNKHPIITDFKYFFKAGYNILFKKARSQ